MLTCRFILTLICAGIMYSEGCFSSHGHKRGRFGVHLDHASLALVRCIRNEKVILDINLLDVTAYLVELFIYAANSLQPRMLLTQ